MSDFVFVLNAAGLLGPMIGVVIAFGAIAVYFGFIKKT